MFVPFTILVALTILKAVVDTLQYKGNHWSLPHLLFILRGDELNKVCQNKFNNKENA